GRATRLGPRRRRTPPSVYLTRPAHGGAVRAPAPVELVPERHRRARARAGIRGAPDAAPPHGAPRATDLRALRDGHAVWRELGVRARPGRRLSGGIRVSAHGRLATRPRGRGLVLLPADLQSPQAAA